MDTDHRRVWNQRFSPELYELYRTRLQNEVGEVPYRLAETPLFIPAEVRDRLFRYTREIIAQLARPELLTLARTSIPPDFDVPGQDDAPGCMTVDFALVRNEHGALDGRVVELQAFPSLYAFTIVQARIFDELLRQQGVPSGFHCFSPDHDFDSAVALFKRVLLQGHDPEEVVLLEIDPQRQKTLPDFIATQALTGIDPVCVTEVEKEGDRLYRRKGGRRLRIRRIFNRVVFDELFRKKPPMAFSFTDPLDVSWCCHPNWYWMWSKFSLPLLDHPALPKTVRLSDLEQVPEDLEQHVLKPLFSYAGAGVTLGPTAEDLARIPHDQRAGWVLQRRIEYARELYTPTGEGVAAEIRILCLRDEGEALPQPFMNLVRLSRGKMLGIDFNKGLDWVGSSVALWPRAR